MALDVIIDTLSGCGTVDLRDFGVVDCKLRTSRVGHIAMSEKAYALHRTNPSESKAEIARLDRMFTK
jgi:nucleoid DNA-binding protein